MTNPQKLSPAQSRILLDKIKQWALDLEFADIGVSNTNLSKAEKHLHEWLAKGFHGSMNYMQKHGAKRTQPALLIPETVSILSLRMDYLPESQSSAIDILNSPNKAFVSRYALGRDYHKLIRAKLEKLAQKVQAEVNDVQYRVFTDSAPVLEKPIAHKSGLGWVGKHSNILNREAGSWFFLGEIYLNFALPESTQRQNHCGQCTECIDVCPTNAIVEPYVVDARKCISYLTIENHGEIPIELRSKMGNRIYGCDDCQLFCPWNRFAKPSQQPDFKARNNLNDASLIELFSWDEDTFLKRFEGSPIRRIGYKSWLRNIAVALGNADKTTENLNALLNRKHFPDQMVANHINWAIEQHKPRQ